MTGFCNDSATLGLSMVSVDEEEDNSDNDAKFAMVPPIEMLKSSPDTMRCWKLVGTLDDLASFESWRSDNPANWKMTSRSSNWINFSCCLQSKCRNYVFIFTSSQSIKSFS